MDGTQRPSRLVRVRRRLVSPHIWGLLLALIVLAVGSVAPVPGVRTDVQRVLAVFLFSVVLWLAKPVPLTIASVTSVCLLFLTGITDSFAEAAAGFASRLVFFLFLLLLLGSAISNVGLADRLAGQLVATASTPRRSYWLLSANILTLAFVMPSGIARTVTFLPIVERLSDRFDCSTDSNFPRASLLVLGQLNPIASLALMTGGGMAILSSEIIRASGEPITWLGWAVHMTPPIVAVYILTTLTIERLYPVDDNARSGPETVSEETNSQGEFLNHQQRVVAGLLVLTILGWVVGSLTGVPTILPPLLAVLVLALPGVKILSSEDVKQLNWGILFLFGAMLSLISVMRDIGAIAFVVDQLLAVVPIGTYSIPIAVAVLLTIILTLRVFFSTASACLAIVLPIVLSLASALGIDGRYLALSVVIVVGSATLLPFHMPPALIVTERGPVTNRDVFVVGVITLAYAVAVIALSWTVYWPLVP
nr:SLC13 family permease [Halorussus halophilus]